MVTDRTGHGHSSPVRRFRGRILGPVSAVRLATGRRRRTGRDLQSHAEKAEAIARQFGIPAVYGDPGRLLREVRPDFVDNITEIGGHKPLSLLCAKHRVACICQKPLAASYRDARQSSRLSRHAHPFFVHENWRWQAPMRQLRQLLAPAPSARRCGRVCRWCRASTCSRSSRRFGVWTSSSSPTSAHTSWTWPVYSSARRARCIAGPRGRSRRASKERTSPQSC